MTLNCIDKKHWKKRGHDFYSTHDGRFDLFAAGQHNWVCIDSDHGHAYRATTTRDCLQWVASILASERRTAA